MTLKQFIIARETDTNSTVTKTAVCGTLPTRATWTHTRIYAKHTTHAYAFHRIYLTRTPESNPSAFLSSNLPFPMLSKLSLFEIHSTHAQFVHKHSFRYITALFFLFNATPFAATNFIPYHSTSTQLQIHHTLWSHQQTFNRMCV